MTGTIDPRAYFSASDHSPGTFVWSTFDGAYVLLSAAAYVDWTNATGQSATSHTEAEILDIVDKMARENYGQGRLFADVTTPAYPASLQLTNPLPDTIYVTQTGTGGGAIILPQMNLPTSRPKGAAVRFVNLGANMLTINGFGEIPGIDPARQVRSGEAVDVVLKQNNTQKGGFYYWDLPKVPITQINGGTGADFSSNVPSPTSGKPKIFMKRYSALNSDFSLEELNVVDLVGAQSGSIYFKLLAANFNTTADQAIAISLPAGMTRYRINFIFITNPSISLTTAVGGFYTAASKGGIAVVAAGTAYSSLTTNVAGASGSLFNATIVNSNVAFYNAATLYLSLTTPQGAAATADVTVIINPLP